jgi:hypothetical protein
LNKPATYKHQSLVWFSEDGRTWSDKHEVGDRDNWLWRITWHKGKAYGFRYGCQNDNRGIRLFRSCDGKSFDTLIDKASVAKPREDYILTAAPPKTFTKFPPNPCIMLTGTNEEDIAPWRSIEVPRGFTGYIYNWCPNLWLCAAE